MGQSEFNLTSFTFACRHCWCPYFLTMLSFQMPNLQDVHVICGCLTTVPSSLAGYKWILVKGGSQDPAPQQQLPHHHQVVSSPKADQWSSASSVADDYSSADSAKVGPLLLRFLWQNSLCANDVLIKCYFCVPGLGA